MKESLSSAYNSSRNGTLMNTVTQYKNILRQSVIALHSLGYPILSFYIDHHLSSRLFNQQHITLVNTIYKLMYTTARLAHSCSLDTAQGRRVSLCGSVHLHNLQSVQTEKFTKIDYRLQVPHMFYIDLEFLEIILWGGFKQYECELYQYLKISYYFTVPFSLKEFNVVQGFLLCGTHQPFAIIVPCNTAFARGVFSVNEYASFKLRYSAMDIQVSTDPLNRRYLGLFF